MKLWIGEIDASFGIITGILLLSVLAGKFIDAPILLLAIAWKFFALTSLDIVHIGHESIGWMLKALAWVHSTVDLLLVFGIIAYIMELEIILFYQLGQYIFVPVIGFAVALFFIVGNGAWIVLSPFIGE